MMESSEILLSSANIHPQSKLIDTQFEADGDANNKMLGNKRGNHKVSTDNKKHESEANDSKDSNLHLTNTSISNKKKTNKDSKGASIELKNNEWENPRLNSILRLPSESSIRDIDESPMFQNATTRKVSWAPYSSEEEDSNYCDDYSFSRANIKNIFHSNSDDDDTQKIIAEMNPYSKPCHKTEFIKNKSGDENEVNMPHDKNDQSKITIGTISMKTTREKSLSSLESLSISCTPMSSTTHTKLQNFATEHRIFLRSILSLLTERDQFAFDTANADDPQTIKVGPLKKASHLMKGVLWKIKYVEIRRGLFSYYEDSSERGKFDWNNSFGNFQVACNGINSVNIASGVTNNNDNNNDNPGNNSHYHPSSLEMSGLRKKKPSLQRKSLPLRANLSTCRAVKMFNDKNGPSPRLPFQNGFIFELTVEGGPRRLWMANSREERQAWIQAIHNAMIGRSVTNGSSYLDYNGVEGDLCIPLDSPYKTDLEIYVSVQREIQKAQSADAYLMALKCLFRRRLRVPVQWIKGQMDPKFNSGKDKKEAFGDASMVMGISQLYKDMLRDSVTINGILFKGDEGHGPERIIGALVRCILKFNSVIIEEQNTSRQTKNKRGKNRKPLKEFKAVSIARDVLLSANRTRSAGDSYFCVETLCSNSDLVVLCPLATEAEPLKITVSQTNLNNLDRKRENKDCKGWIKIRNKITKRWKKRFCVLGEGGVFSYYEKEKPRPHGLRAQIIMLHAKMEISSVGGGKHIVTTIPRNRSSERQFCFENDQDFLKWKAAFQRAIDGELPDTYEQGKLNYSSPSQYDCGEDEILVNEQTRARTKSLDRDSDDAVKKKIKEKKSSLYINIEAHTAYKICTTDPDGIDENDTWVTLKTRFLQTFCLSGSKLHRGEEIVELLVLKGLQK